ncbi:hypothetical protein [Parapedobacter composti]|nr:hypothetical protein [Parapedobacter composti]
MSNDAIRILKCLAIIGCLFIGKQVSAKDDLRYAYYAVDTTAVAQQERPSRVKEGSPDKANGKVQEVVKPDDIVTDVQQVVKKVPKARRQAKPVSVPSVKVKPPVKVNPPKIKTALPVKIKL